MPSMEVQERPVFEVEQSRTHRHTDTQTHRQKFLQTIYCNTPEGGGSIMHTLILDVWIFSPLIHPIHTSKINWIYIITIALYCYQYTYK